jgi:hypothetical protein
MLTNNQKKKRDRALKLFLKMSTCYLIGFILSHRVSNLRENIKKMHSRALGLFVTAITCYFIGFILSHRVNLRDIGDKFIALVCVGATCYILYRFGHYYYYWSGDHIENTFRLFYAETNVKYPGQRSVFGYSRSIGYQMIYRVDLESRTVHGFSFRHYLGPGQGFWWEPQVEITEFLVPMGKKN